MVVALLVERLLPTSEICGSNPVIGNIIYYRLYCINCVEKTKIKKKRPNFLADDIFNQSPFTHLSIFVLKDQRDVQNREYFSFPLIDEGIKSFHNQWNNSPLALSDRASSSASATTTPTPTPCSNSSLWPSKLASEPRTCKDKFSGLVTFSDALLSSANFSRVHLNNEWHTLRWIISNIKLTIPGPFIIYFCLFNSVERNYKCLMTGFELRISVVGCNCSTNCATTTVLED